MRYCVFLVAACMLVTLGCRGASLPTVENPSPDCDALASRLDRGDWMVNKQTKIWKVSVDQSLQNMPPKHVGYLVGKRYRQMRGGPEFQMYTVTSLNRNEQLGHIDSVGRAVRYEPRRNRGFTEVPVGAGTLENNVAAIFDTLERVTLEPTTQKRLAFEALDVNGDGLLQPAEMERYGDRIRSADSNRDGLVDFEEFATIETF
ncbi:MAG: EF-hand domain-containing protein [Planctomycetota bacterium]|nr:EF-hand domain-containing protein [Planctomycetota bacterium]